MQVIFIPVQSVMVHGFCGAPNETVRGLDDTSLKERQEGQVRDKEGRIMGEECYYYIIIL